MSGEQRNRIISPYTNSEYRTTGKPKNPSASVHSTSSSERSGMSGSG